MKLSIGPKSVSVERKVLDDFRMNTLMKHWIKVVLPENIHVNFSFLYGHTEEKKVLRDIVRYFKGADIKPHTSYYLYGPIGTGKASLVYATGKEANIPVITCESSTFQTLENENDVDKILALLFDTAKKLQKKYKGVIIAFRNSEWIEGMQNDSLFYSNLIRYSREAKNTFLFLLTSSDEIFVPAEVVENEMFSTLITVDYPDLETREKIFTDFINQYHVKLAEDVSINRLAKDALGFTPITISYIVREAYLYSKRQNHTKVTSADFAETIDRLSYGSKTVKMTEKERIITAYHEAGHVVAGYYSDPNYVLKRVEISPRGSSLGLTQADVDENKYSYFQKDYKNMIIFMLGGYAAEEYKYHSHTSGVVADLSSANTIAANMVKAYGMSKVLGPMVIIPNVTDSGTSKAKAEGEIKEILDQLLKDTKDIIATHEKSLEALAHALLAKEVVTSNEVKEIFEKAESSEET